MKHLILIVKKRNVLADYWSQIFMEAGHQTIVCNTNDDDVLEAVRSQLPTVLLIEATFADDRGFELTRLAKQIHPALRCIVCLPAIATYYAEAVQTDISGYLPDDIDDAGEVIKGLDQVTQGYRYISQTFRITLSLPSNQHKKVVDALSGRQKQILKLLAKGYTSRQIAQELAIAEPTVRHHKEQITELVGLPGVYQLKFFVSSIAHLL